MKRRSFITKGAAGLAASLSLPAFSFAHTKEGWGCVRSSNEVEANMLIRGLKAPFTILQISDTHISCDAEPDKAYEEYSGRMGRAFPTVVHYKTKEKVAPLEGFAAMMELAKEAEVDFMALTGDIINYPSATAVREVLNLVKATNIPYVYTAGNHDWHYEGMAGSADQLRAEWAEKRLKPLYDGNPLFASSIRNGVNVVTIDNSTYQVNEEQFAFYKKQRARPEPVALFVHIPLYMPNLKTGSCGHPEWGAAVDKGFEIERRERWPASGNKSSTEAFLKEVMRTEKLIGIFAGHYHRSATMSYKDQHQYISGAGFNGQYRLIRFSPLVLK